MPSGVSTPWLMALLRKKILAGSMNTDVSGSRSWSTRNCTTEPSPSVIFRTMGASTNMPRTAITAERIPAEKLLTSISNPGLIRWCHIASARFITQAVSGPMIMAPRNIGAPGSLPMNTGSLVAMMTPMTANAPTTPPRTS